MSSESITTARGERLNIDELIMKANRKPDQNAKDKIKKRDLPDVNRGMVKVRGSMPVGELAVKKRPQEEIKETHSLADFTAIRVQKDYTKPKDEKSSTAAEILNELDSEDESS